MEDSEQVAVISVAADMEGILEEENKGDILEAVEELRAFRACQLESIIMELAQSIERFVFSNDHLISFISAFFIALM